jgi:hypothetical protein
VTEQVELVISNNIGTWFVVSSFFVSSEDRLEPSGSYDVILGRRWKDEFGDMESSGYRAAPTYYRDHAKGQFSSSLGL